MGATAQQVKAFGVASIKEAPNVGVLYATLTQDQVSKLRAAGFEVEKVGTVRASVSPPTPIAAVPTYTPEVLTQAAGLEDLRYSISPPLYGEGINLAIIDTGIRESHEKVRDRVVYRKNFTSSPMHDGFDHGTGVCSVALSVVPSCNILNLKVLNDEGEGTEEEVVLAIDDCIGLISSQPGIAPTVANISLGSPDDGNPSNSMRVACRAAINRGIWIIAAAGNGGPNPTTVTNPACEQNVIAVGSAKFEPFVVSDFSSRGPTKEGLVKPDGIFFGEDIALASSDSDTATTGKSGTSFSAPFISGLIAAYQESIVRFGGEARYGGEVEYPPGIAPGIPTGVPRVVSPQEMLEGYLPRACIKPQGVQAGKDDNYGYGLPFGPLVFQAFGLGVGVDISSMLSVVVVIGMMGMMTKVMK